jgi:hypothetical protein
LQLNHEFLDHAIKLLLIKLSYILAGYPYKLEWVIYQSSQIARLHFNIIRDIRSPQRMNKANLIQALKDANNLTKSEAEKIVTLFFDKIRRTGKRGSC